VCVRHDPRIDPAAATGTAFDLHRGKSARNRAINA
jgi:hypothetical protein